jgi:hypothetical protein
MAWRWSVSDACRWWRPVLHSLRSETCIGPVQLALELSLASYHIGLRTSFHVARYYIIRYSIDVFDVAFVQYFVFVYFSFQCMHCRGSVGNLAVNENSSERAANQHSTIPLVIALSTLRNTPIRYPRNILRQEWPANRGMRLSRPGLS